MENVIVKKEKTFPVPGPAFNEIDLVSRKGEFEKGKECKFLVVCSAPLSNYWVFECATMPEVKERIEYILQHETGKRGRIYVYPVDGRKEASVERRLKIA